MRMSGTLAAQRALGFVSVGGAMAHVRRLTLAALLAAGLLAALAQPATAHHATPATPAPHPASLHGIQAECGGVPVPC
jgi:hypothetical protein